MKTQAFFSRPTVDGQRLGPEVFRRRFQVGLYDYSYETRTVIDDRENAHHFCILKGYSRTTHHSVERAPVTPTYLVSRNGNRECTGGVQSVKTWDGGHFTEFYVYRFIACE